jgi:hypothetical protein
MQGSRRDAYIRPLVAGIDSTADTSPCALSAAADFRNSSGNSGRIIPSFPGKVITRVSAVSSLGRIVRKSKIRWRMPGIATYAELRAWGARAQARMLFERAGTLSGKCFPIPHDCRCRRTAPNRSE